MKSKRPHQSARAFLALSMGAGLMLSQVGNASGLPAEFGRSRSIPGEEKPARKKAGAKTYATKNNPIKIYPDALGKEMHVISRITDGKEIDFFVFDLQGTLVHNYRFKSKEHRKITGLAKGSYVYRVFSGDEETAAGKFEIR